MSSCCWSTVELPDPSEVRFAIAAFASAQRASAAVVNSSVDTAEVDVVEDDVTVEVVGSSPPQPVDQIAIDPAATAASVAVFPLIAARLAPPRDTPEALDESSTPDPPHPPSETRPAGPPPRRTSQGRWGHRRRPSTSRRRWCPHRPRAPKGRPAGHTQSQAAGQGFEPRIPLPERGVLPLHQPAVRRGGLASRVRRGRRPGRRSQPRSGADRLARIDQAPGLEQVLGSADREGADDTVGLQIPGRELAAVGIAPPDDLVPVAAPPRYSIDAQSERSLKK